MEDIIFFSQTNTAGRDESHDFEHHVKVNKHTTQIAKWYIHTHPDQPMIKKYGSNYIKLLASAIAYLHDVPDHKYYENPDEIYNSIRYMLQRSMFSEHTEIIIDIINNISYSKEKKGLLKDLGDWNFLRDIVSDADKIEALGWIGLVRCYEYTKFKNPEMDEDNIFKNMRDHCEDKLNHLIDYIRTDKGKELAEEGQNIIIRWHSGELDWKPKKS